MVGKVVLLVEYIMETAVSVKLWIFICVDYGIKRVEMELGVVTHACNPSTLSG